MVPKGMVDHLLLLIGALLVMNTQFHCEGNDKVDVTILESAVSKGAVCLDGSPPAYQYAKGFGDGAKNWMVYLEGGGWCDSKSDCLKRANEALGSSKKITPNYFGGILSQSRTTNLDFYNWNRVMVRYCDGSSFTGDVEEIDQETNLHRRGARVFNAIVEDLLAKGMKNASNVMLVGNSAGGLATILNCDHFRALVPSASKLKCIADSGFFIRAKDLPGAEERESYYARVVEFHNITRFLPKSCTSKMDPGLCFFPENLVGDIQTPLFLLNSAFDKFQITYKLKPHPADEPQWQNCIQNIGVCSPGQLQIIRDFRTAFLETLQDIGNCSSRGMFINSCYIHDFLWSTARWNGNGSPRLGNKTIAQAIGDWYFERSFVQEIDTKNDYPLNCTDS
ncbi:hypothetical protein BUALT_Bualt01G0123700 [Buddleja alternifolia]|uniref:Pectin acetylesterase n=1 Tax=Buddleja alternifolia TaxID=168488 RepID=A0AAV6Y7I6_9LAMI|nr:hypothetical protein BUALT_Bualt01G0123700 [Buddleja alternifolia]